ncbi:MAG: ribonuclease III domain-containing protein [Tissierellia bacterium]|nr:ribonuclease III domain-containing protein [Tissierellia bacterium]
MEADLRTDIFLREEKRTPREAAQLPPLVLAFLGDGVFELFIRTYHMGRPAKVHQLHQKTAAIVKAQTQAKLVKDLEAMMTGEEAGVFRRGRNAQSKTMAKNASVSDYRYATGFEALLGYLYISGQNQRLKDYFDAIERMIEGEG